MKWKLIPHWLLINLPLLYEKEKLLPLHLTKFLLRSFHYFYAVWALSKYFLENTENYSPPREKFFLLYSSHVKFANYNIYLVRLAWRWKDNKNDNSIRRRGKTTTMIRKYFEKKSIESRAEMFQPFASVFIRVP